MHWFVLSCYSNRLQKLGVWGEGEEGYEGEEGCGGEILPEGKWLRCVAVTKLPGLAVEEPGDGAVPPASECDWDAEHTKGGTLQAMKLDIALSAHSRDPTPHLSCREREGLLMLLTNMKQDRLFEEDVPSCIPHPCELLERLLAQLHSPAINLRCSPQPSGVPLLTPPPKEKRRKRGSAQPGPRSKHKLSKPEHSGHTQLLKLADSSKTTKCSTRGCPPQTTVHPQHCNTPNECIAPTAARGLPDPI